MTPVRDTCLLTKSPVPWLNKTFLETALRTGYSAATLNITKYDVKPAVGKGDNYTSDLYRVKVHTATGNVFHLIIKRELSGDDMVAELLRKSTAFLRETHMYSTTAVKLNSILQGALPGGCERLAARYVYSCPRTLVLEDLCAEGFKMTERRKGLDLDHCLLVMRTLAKFHAASVVLHDQDPESMSVYEQSFFSEPETREGLQKFVSGSLKSVAKAVDSWPGYSERYPQKLRALADVMLDRIVQVTQRDDTAFNVLNHGDLWVNNMLFRYSGAPDGLRFLDFQLLHFSSPAIDLQYYFNTSPCEEVRLHHLGRLMEEYHNTLCDTLKAMGYSHKHITLEELRKEYENKALYGLYGACCVLPIVLADKGIEVEALMESETAHNFETYNGDFYKKALQRMLPEFEEKGVFRC